MSNAEPRHAIGRPCQVCSRQAMGVYGVVAYCAVHRPGVGRRVNVDDVAHAKTGLAAGDSLKSIAAELGLFTADLDYALWQALGEPAALRRYAPDFVQ